MIKLSDHLYIPPMGRVIADAKAAKKTRHKRYAAASGSRLQSGWVMQPESANALLLQNTAILRARARQMARDNYHAKKYLRMCRSNIVGQNGIQLQCRAKNGEKLNKDLNKRVEQTFFEWGYRETCTLSGKLDWLAAQRLFVTTLARDGEVLVQKVRADNAFGFALKFIDVSWLSEGYNTILPNGNLVLMSVEIDANSRPVAYHLTPPTSDIELARRSRYDTVRVPADEIIHSYLIYDDEAQVRGVTWFHAALMPGRSLQSYVEAVLTQARMTAMSIGFIEEDVADDGQFEGETDAEGNLIDPVIDFSPGSFTKLNPGQKVSQWDPKQPTQNHAEFKRGLEHDEAAGFDVNYFELTGDMASVNYSSARIGLGETRENWKDMQDFVATGFCREVYHAWLPQALLSGKLDVSPDEYTQIFNPYWRPRGWQYIDPQKEIKAALDGIEGGIMTKTAHLASQGIDLVDFLEEKKQEMELFAEYGVEYSTPQMAPAGNNSPADGQDVQDPTQTGRSYSNGHAELIS